jgi:dTDP-4-dehydrorhamnose 3,5-epimerase
MQVEPLAIADVKLLRPRVFRDERGHFIETWNARTFAELGIPALFVQDNLAYSKSRGTVRGLHYQLPPNAQGKLVRVARGAILDVAVDMRKGSPSFGRHVSATLTAHGGEQIWVPTGFAHGYCTLEPDTEVIYKVTDFYAPGRDQGILWNDPALGIAWPVDAAAAILSDKDRILPHFATVDTPFEITGPSV